MSSEERVKAEPRAGTFSGCLVEGDAETTARERKIKRRAVGISIALQTAGLAALLIAPLFAKPAALVERVATPVPPYGHPVRHERTTPTPPRPTQVCVICPTLPVRPATPSYIQDTIPNDPGPTIETESGPANPTNILNGTGSQPVWPDDPPRQKKPLVVGHIDPALLTHRVEPVFPALARQLHRTGRVELRAIIGTDGSVQSLQVVSGDTLFINSAREAVLQWRYKPTYLNGEPMEVDTYITVIYTLQ